MLPNPKPHVTEDEYLAFERDAEGKHELINGEIVAMSGGSPRHSLIAQNIGWRLAAALGGGRCLVFSSDLRVQVESTRLYTYPDVTVVCGTPQYSPHDRHTVVNPTLIIEVLSPSTEAWDRGAKFAHYRRLPALQGVLLVSQDACRIEHFQRVADERWLLTEATEGTLELAALGVTLRVDEVYAGVDQLGDGQG